VSSTTKGFSREGRRRFSKDSFSKIREGARGEAVRRGALISWQAALRQNRGKETRGAVTNCGSSCSVWAGTWIRPRWSTRGHFVPRALPSHRRTMPPSRSRASKAARFSASFVTSFSLLGCDFGVGLRLFMIGRLLTPWAEKVGLGGCRAAWLRHRAKLVPYGSDNPLESLVRNFAFW